MGDMVARHKNAPKIVQECIASQRLYINNNYYEYHLLNSETVWKYVELPQEIIEKFNRKEIGFAHFSDILRLALIKNMEESGWMPLFL